jgi:SNF2 family DNA or RNA helicase
MMKIALSKKDDPRGRHCTLYCEGDEQYAAQPVINREILQGRARIVKEVAGEDGQDAIFRFNLKYLDYLALAFPMAELSHGITVRLKRAEEKRLDGMRIPEIKIPGFTGKLYDFQAVAVGLITDEAYAQECGYPTCIDYENDEMGLGKTFVALSAIAVKQAYPALLIVPNNAKYTAWADVIEEFFPKLSYGIYDTQTQSVAERAAVLNARHDLTIVNIEAIRAKPIHEDPDDLQTPIVGYDYANPELFDFEYEFAVLDEHHRVKTPGAQVTNGFFQLVANQWLCMSGTPILNRPMEIWTVLHKIYPEDFPDFYEFERNLVVEKEGYVIGYRPHAMKELRDFLASTSIRRRKDQVLKDLPEVTTVTRLVTLNAEERRILSQIEEELILEMEDGSVTNIGGALPQIIRMKQACFSPELFGGSPHSSKMVELDEIVSELVASGQKAIIFSQWEKAAKIIQREMMHYNPAYVTGKVKNKTRAAEIRKFNEDEDCHIYIGTIDANREAINLGIATYVIFTDEGWVPAADDQAIGRSAAGGLRGVHLAKDVKVTVIALQAEDTYEQNSVSLMKDRKRAVVNRTVERDGGKDRKVKKVTLNDLKGMLSSSTKKKMKRKAKSAA